MPDPTPVPMPEMSTPALQDKRLWLALATMATVALNRKMGLQLEGEDLAALAGLAAGYIAQSQWGVAQRAKAAGQAASDKVTTLSEATHVFKGSTGPSKGLLLALGLSVALASPRAWAQDVPPPTAAQEVKGARLRLPDDTMSEAGPGCYLPEKACLSAAKELAGLRAEAAELRKAPISPWVVVGLVVLALGGGFAVGRAVR